MMNILIADAGGTSTRWVLCDAQGIIREDMQCQGINASVSSTGAITACMAAAAPLISRASSIYFYGAGCKGGMACSRIKDEIYKYAATDCFVEINSDLLGAARALFGSKTGIACILGTGSNSGCYDGVNITQNVPSLGYILGDEGSGVDMCKKFIASVLRDEIKDSGVLDDFYSAAGGDYAHIIDKIYRQERANSFIASFAPVLSKHRANPAVKVIITDSIAEFKDRCVANYPNIYTIGFVGSIAKAFEPELQKVFENTKYEIRAIEKDPLPGLIKYHSGTILPSPSVI